MTVWIFPTASLDDTKAPAKDRRGLATSRRG